MCVGVWYVTYECVCKERVCVCVSFRENVWIYLRYIASAYVQMFVCVREKKNWVLCDKVCYRRLEGLCMCLCVFYKENAGMCVRSDSCAYEHVWY